MKSLTQQTQRAAVLLASICTPALALAGGGGGGGGSSRVTIPVPDAMVLLGAVAALALAWHKSRQTAHVA